MLACPDTYDGIRLGQARTTYHLARNPEHQDLTYQDPREPRLPSPSGANQAARRGNPARGQHVPRLRGRPGRRPAEALRPALLGRLPSRHDHSRRVRSLRPGGRDDVDERPRWGDRMTASVTATIVALAVGLPIVALGERIREREERRLNHPPNSPTRKDLS